MGFVKLLAAFVALTAIVWAAPSEPILDDMFCHTCVDAVDNTECNTTVACDAGHTHCITEMFYDEQAISIVKRCAKMQVCYNKQENNADGCENPDDTTEGYCAYCCSYPGCNAPLPPYHEDDDNYPAPAPGHGNSKGAHGHGGGKSKTTSAGRGPAPTRSGGATPHRPSSAGKGPGPTRAGGATPHRPSSAGKGPGPTRHGGTSRPTSAGKVHPRPTAPPAVTQAPPATQAAKTAAPVATQAPTVATSAPLPATAAPANNNNINIVVPNTSGGTQACHCHAGQPCSQTHVQSPLSNLLPGLNIDLSIHISGGQITGMQQQSNTPCPCLQQAKSSPMPSAAPVTTAQAPAVTATIPPDTTTPTTGPAAKTAAPVTTTAAKTTAATTPTKKPATATIPADTTTTTKNPATMTIPADTTKQPATVTIPADTTKKPATVTIPADTTTLTKKPATVTIPADTTKTAVTATIPPDTTTPKGKLCYMCDDSSCRSQKLITCQSDQYCMNTVAQTISGARVFSKGCASRSTCDKEWWQKTAGMADCFLLNDSARGRPGTPLNACSFCCHGDGCNQHTIPQVSTLYDPNRLP